MSRLFDIQWWCFAHCAGLRCRQEFRFANDASPDPPVHLMGNASVEERTAREKRTCGQERRLSEFTIFEHREPLLKRLFAWSMAVLLTIRGTCACLRAKVATFQVW